MFFMIDEPLPASAVDASWQTAGHADTDQVAGYDSCIRRHHRPAKGIKRANEKKPIDLPIRS